MKPETKYYRIRLNLAIEEDYQLHRAIVNADQSIYKSTNDYLKSALIRGVFNKGDNGRNIDVSNLQAYVKKEDLESMKNEIYQQLSQQMIGILLQYISGAMIPQNHQQGQNNNIAENKEADIPSQQDNKQDIDPALLEVACNYF